MRLAVQLDPTDQRLVMVVVEDHQTPLVLVLLAATVRSRAAAVAVVAPVSMALPPAPAAMEPTASFVFGAGSLPSKSNDGLASGARLSSL